MPRVRRPRFNPSFRVRRNTAVAVGRASGGEAPFVPSLDFSQSANSMYFPFFF
jgi:hypothetical protein